MSDFTDDLHNQLDFIQAQGGSHIVDMASHVGDLLFSAQIETGLPPTFYGITRAVLAEAGVRTGGEVGHVLLTDDNIRTFGDLLLHAQLAYQDRAGTHRQEGGQ